MPLLGLLAAVTVTATVTVETAEGVRPVSHAVLYAETPDTDPPRRRRGGPPLELRCGPEGVDPPVSVLVGTRRLKIVNDRAALTHAHVEAESGLVLLTATLVSRGQATPQVRLPKGRVRVTCESAGRAVEGHVLALSHARFAVTDEGGAATFEALEGASWRIWHPALGRVEYTVTASAAVPRPTF